jgi:hypothetical protein
MLDIGGRAARLAVFAVICSELSAIDMSSSAAIPNGRWFGGLKTAG